MAKKGRRFMFRRQFEYESHIHGKLDYAATVIPLSLTEKEARRLAKDHPNYIMFELKEVKL